MELKGGWKRREGKGKELILIECQFIMVFEEYTYYGSLT